jgi:hypothetical protein
MLKIVKTSIAIATASLIFAGNAQADVGEALNGLLCPLKTPIFYVYPL